MLLALAPLKVSTANFSPRQPKDRPPMLITTLFTPPAGPQAAIIAALSQAKTQVRMWIYTFGNPAILQACLDCRGRGVDIAAVVDVSLQLERNKLANELAAAGIPVYVDEKVKIMHMKSIVIDSSLTITGSYNFSLAAEHANAEDIAFIQDPETARIYLLNWRVRQAEAKLWQPF